MVATPYKNVQWDDRSLSVEKLQVMTNNEQWLFENTPRMRYNANGLIRDTAIKIICGKNAYPIVANDYQDVAVYFGSFFSAGCKPIVTASVEHNEGGARRLATIRGLSGEIDHRGFISHVTTQEDYPGANRAFNSPGWVHWMAIGY